MMTWRLKGSVMDSLEASGLCDDGLVVEGLHDGWELVWKDSAMAWRLKGFVMMAWMLKGSLME